MTTTTAADAPPTTPFRLGFFTRLVDQLEPARLYAQNLELFTRAEEWGYDSGWVAQHHVNATGGLPAPLVFLMAAAARTARIRLATGVVTLPFEQPLRLAEDAAVLDILSGGRLELGLGTGSGDRIFTLFGRDIAAKQGDYDQAYAALHDALAGKPLLPDGPALFPPNPGLLDRLWEGTFGVEGAIRTAAHGNGLLLARTASRPALTDNAATQERQPLGDVQWPLVEGYLAHWTRPAPPRLGLSRSLFVAPTRQEALAAAAPAVRRLSGQPVADDDFTAIAAFLARTDIHIGSPDDVIAILRADRLLAHASDLILQVHPIDPPHDRVLQSLRLLATEVAPALGWRPGGALAPPPRPVTAG